jgi:uncharacterized membrane protein YgcG
MADASLVTPSTRALRLVAAAAVIAAVLWLPGVVLAQAGERIPRYEVEIQIEGNGDLLVTERIVYDFGVNERHGIYRDIPVRFFYDDSHDRLYEVDVLDVKGSPGTPAEFELEEEGTRLRIRIGDPDLTITGRHTYTISYRVAGALNTFTTHDELYWNAVGTEWTVPIDQASAEVTTPVPIELIACFAGAQGSTLPCTESEMAGRRATFSHSELSPGGGLTVAVGIPTGTVAPAPRPILEERWTFARAFSVTPLTVGLTAVLLIVLLGAVFRLMWVTGRDRRVIGSQVDIAFATGQREQAVPLGEESLYPVEFAPPDDIRPGQVGVLVDEEANPADITATIVDLAVRGYLRIEEIPKRWILGKPDWRLVQLRDSDGGLLRYEAALLDGLFRDTDGEAEEEEEEPGDEELAEPEPLPPASSFAPGDGELASVKLSSLRRKFFERYQRVRSALYADARRRRWFAGRPDKVRQSWAGRGWVVIIAGGALTWLAARLTHFGLVPLTIVVTGIVMIVGARWMPRRTPLGTGLVRRVLGFRTYIATAEVHMARWAEQENIFSRYLPYAIVFGLTEKWARAFARLGETPETSWYVSSRPFTPYVFASSIDNFAVTSAGALSFRPAASGSSGLGGGGFSGGGGGGGGGGSW